MRVSSDDSVLSGHCRILRPSQWDLVRRLRLEAMRQSPNAFLGSYDEVLAYSEDDWRKTFEDASWHGFFVAENHSSARAVIGIARSSRLSQFPDERYIESFWVHNDYRRKQVGRRMLQSIMREAVGEGRNVIRLSVLWKNTEAILAFAELGLITIVPGRSNQFEVCLELALD